IERIMFKPLHNASILSQLVAFIALFSILNSGDGYLWDYTIKTFPTPFGTSPFLGSVLIGSHQAGMIGVTVVLLGVLYLFFRGTRAGAATGGGGQYPRVGPPRGYPGRLDDSARLGHCGGDRRDCWHADRADRVSRPEHDVRCAAVRLCRCGAGRADQSRGCRA